MSNTALKPKKGSMCDSMDITATFLKQLGINIKSKYKGKNVLSEKKLFVISESCGGGNSDIKRKDVYFTICTKKYKLMAILNNYSLTVTKFFDLQKDPLELTNLNKSNNHKPGIKKLLSILYKNRKEIFDIKGVKGF